jgi:hypothetical protein
MAAHGEVEYATAEGNDYREHVGTYNFFLRITLVAILYIVCILLGLTIGGVLGHWLLAAAVIIVSTVTAVFGLATNNNIPSIAVLVLSLLALAFTA